MAVTSFRDLEAWQKAMDLVASVYQATRGMPKEEIYGLTSQMRRAAVSIPSNIAEGHARRTTGEYLNQLSAARGSLMELNTQLEITQRLEMLTPEALEPVQSLAATTGRLLNGLMTALERRL